MNEKRIAMGALAWYLGVLVPVIHHAVLFAAAVRTPTDNVVRLASSLAQNLPLFDWVYLGAMAILGCVLVISGIMNKAKT